MDGCYDERVACSYGSWHVKWTPVVKEVTCPQCLVALAQAEVDERRHLYEQLAAIERTIPHEPDPEVQPEHDTDAGYPHHAHHPHQEESS